MTLRDLTEEERKKLIKECVREFDTRNKSRPVNSPFDWQTYRTGFSDGIRTVIRILTP
jgi:hypothetical protein